MGQRNYELLNKAPQYIFWDSLWYSNFAYKSYFYLDIFLKKLFHSLFFFKVSTFFFLKSKNLNFKNFFVSDINEEEFILNNEYTTFYLSKYWLLNYKNWLICSFFVYYPINSSNFFLDNSNVDMLENIEDVCDIDLNYISFYFNKNLILF